jgi:endonuclease YncB( thermonuclease family)
VSSILIDCDKAGRIAAAWLLALIVSQELPAAAAANDCEPGAGKPVMVAALIDGETIRLGDGRIIRLAGVVRDRTGFAHAKAGRQFNDGVLALALNRRARLKLVERRADRYGRWRAHVFVQGEPQIWLQARMVASGSARVSAFRDDAQCAKALLVLEQAARGAGLGLWAKPKFGIRRAHDTARLNGDINTFQIVEGRIRQVARRRKRIYFNFGADWRQDFTATIAPGQKRYFIKSGLDLDALQGKMVRVRGWVISQDGPMIGLAHPMQIELVSAK